MRECVVWVEGGFKGGSEGDASRYGSGEDAKLLELVEGGGSDVGRWGKGGREEITTNVINPSQDQLEIALESEKGEKAYLSEEYRFKLV
jgi:hypothetical protein